MDQSTESISQQVQYCDLGKFRIFCTKIPRKKKKIKIFHFWGRIMTPGELTILYILLLLSNGKFKCLITDVNVIGGAFAISINAGHNRPGHETLWINVWYFADRIYSQHEMQLRKKSAAENRWQVFRSSSA